MYSLKGESVTLCVFRYCGWTTAHTLWWYLICKTEKKKSPEGLFLLLVREVC